MRHPAPATKRAPARFGLALAVGPVLMVLLASALALGPAPTAAAQAGGGSSQDGSSQDGSSQDGSSRDGSSRSPASAPDSAPLVGVTSGGSWRVEVRTTPSPIPFNEMFTVDVRVTRADAPDALAEGVVVTATSWMPEHRHGATLQPQMTSPGDGTARGVGFLFHMAGRWELRLGVAVDGTMERVVFPIDLEP